MMKAKKEKTKMSSAPEGETRCKQADDAVFRTTPDGIMILVPEEGTVHLLDEVGSRIWDICSEPVSASQIADVIQSEYEVDGTRVQRDVDGFLQRLLEMGALVEVV
jgi:hypothetical protein